MKLPAALVCALVLAVPATAHADPVLDLEHLDGPTAVEMMEDGELTSVQLTRAYIARIAALNKRGPGLNAVTQLNKDALKDAAQLDKERKELEATVNAELEAKYLDLIESEDWHMVDKQGRTLPILCPYLRDNGEIDWTYNTTTNVNVLTSIESTDPAPRQDITTPYPAALVWKVLTVIRGSVTGNSHASIPATVTMTPNMIGQNWLLAYRSMLQASDPMWAGSKNSYNPRIPRPRYSGAEASWMVALPVVRKMTLATPASTHAAIAVTSVGATASRPTAIA